MDQENANSAPQQGANEDSTSSNNRLVSEVTITVNLEENRENSASCIREESQDLGLESKGSRFDKATEKNAKEEEQRCSSCVIDVKYDEKLGDGESQSVCRICHLSAWESGKSLVNLIELGCGCKGELGFGHSHCAEAWFKLKGNRLCEICGENAKNITGAADNKFMEEWNENRAGNRVPEHTERVRGCFHGQLLCNFLMGCLVIAFVLPWFFRVNMF